VEGRGGETEARFVNMGTCMLQNFSRKLGTGKLQAIHTLGTFKQHSPLARR
jgi:hypothetical protein